ALRIAQALTPTLKPRQPEPHRLNVRKTWRFAQARISVHFSLTQPATLTHLQAALPLWQRVDRGDRSSRFVSRPAETMASFPSLSWATQIMPHSTTLHLLTGIPCLPQRTAATACIPSSTNWILYGPST